jgi:hypothetical protein
MAKFSRPLIISFLLFMFTVMFAILSLGYRVAKLERICHAQCKYGDSECAKRCAKAGHCEFMAD